MHVRIREGIVRVELLESEIRLLSSGGTIAFVLPGYGTSTLFGETDPSGFRLGVCIQLEPASRAEDPAPYSS
jgi:hypothetical protein